MSANRKRERAISWRAFLSAARAPPLAEAVISRRQPVCRAVKPSRVHLVQHLDGPVAAIDTEELPRERDRRQPLAAVLGLRHPAFIDLVPVLEVVTGASREVFRAPGDFIGIGDDVRVTYT
jgi:hypothetical protein